MCPRILWTLWSSQPVEFRWNGHSGRAASGVEIIMHPPQEGDSGLMSVSDVSEIRLLGRVTCHLHFPAKRRGDEDVELQISSANGFDFDLDTKIGTFFGFRNRSLDPENQVLVRRPTGNNQADRLVCSQLTTVLRPEVDPQSGEVSSNRLSLEQIVAEGERVVFHSQKHDLVAVMSELRYSIDQRQLDMRNLLRDERDRILPVRLTQRTSVLEVPHIRIIHGESNNIQQIFGFGQGRLTHANNSDSLTATWTHELAIRQRDDVSGMIILTGRASVSQNRQQFGLQAKSIEMKLNGDIQLSDQSARKKSQSSVASEQIDLSAIQPKSLRALGDVVVRSADLTGTVRNELNVSFTSVEENTSGSFQTVSLNTASAKSANSHEFSGSNQNSPPITFVADSLQATVHLPDRTSQSEQAAQLSDLWLKGDVRVSREDSDPGRSFTASGNALHAAQGLQNTHDIKLFGAPAKATGSTLELEGQRIDINELTDQFTVNGSGKLRLVTDKGLDGKPLPRPTPLDIYWTESMTFRGRVAQFIGNIRAVLNDEQTIDLELKSSGLKVYFTRDVSLNRESRDSNVQEFAVGQSDGPSVELEKVECQNRVEIRVDQLDSGDVTARHRAVMADLTVNVISGEVSGVGPGWISSVSPDTDDRRRPASTIRVGVNTPAVIHDTAFNYVRASFIGDLTGNLNDQFANLSHHVTGIFAPVQNIDDVVNVESMSVAELPDQCGIIRSEQLSISVIPGSQSNTETFSLTARDNARIESRQFSGDADVITYDDSKRQFILRAEQGRMASVRHRPGNSSQFQTINGKRFEYYPAPRNQLIANQISGVQAAE